jgi:glutathione S-transferase
MSDDRISIYGDRRSGNCYKLQLLCAELGMGYDWHDVDILAGDTHTPDFLALNPNGKIPLLRLPDGRCLAESNAILCYLADGSEFFYGDAFDRATALQWLFFEQYSHEPFIATSRFIIQYRGSPPERQNDLEQKREGGLKALRIMEQQLEQCGYMAGSRYSIADIALFAYTHVSHEGGFPLEDFPAIRAWIDKIMSRPNFVPMVTK